MDQPTRYLHYTLFPAFHLASNLLTDLLLNSVQSLASLTLSFSLRTSVQGVTDSKNIRGLDRSPLEVFVLYS